MPMPRAAAASSKQTARNGSGVPVASEVSARLKSQADGQKHLPDSMHTNGSRRTIEAWMKGNGIRAGKGEP